MPYCTLFTAYCSLVSIIYMKYVHGYSGRESVRLVDQAVTLSELLHGDTFYGRGKIVLEAGCGVGAQTVLLAGHSPEARITSIDISEESLAKAQALVRKHKIKNVTFQQADIFDLPFKNESFDHVFICFVLEHLPDPLKALASLKKVLKKGGTLTAIEGDHGSAYFHPESMLAKKTIQCLIDIQAQMGGDSLIGRRLYPLLKQAAFRSVTTSPRVVYADASRPAMVKGFTLNTFIAMVEGVKDQAIANKMITKAEWTKGIRELYQSAEKDGTFNYTFFKAVAFK